MHGETAKKKEIRCLISQIIRHSPVSSNSTVKYVYPWAYAGSCTI